MNSPKNKLFTVLFLMVSTPLMCIGLVFAWLGKIIVSGCEEAEYKCLVKPSGCARNSYDFFFREYHGKH